MYKVTNLTFLDLNNNTTFHSLKHTQSTVWLKYGSMWSQGGLISPQSYEEPQLLFIKASYLVKTQLKVAASRLQLMATG